MNGTAPRSALRLHDAAGHLVVDGTPEFTAAHAGAVLDAQRRVGAFPLRVGEESAVVHMATGGALHVVGGLGVAPAEHLVELYVEDDDTASGPRNASARFHLGGASRAGIVGFVLSGDQPQEVLIRAVSASLGRFGLPTLAEVHVRLCDGEGRLICESPRVVLRPEHAAEFAAAVGAFPISSGPGDATLSVSLSPGIYTMVVTGEGEGEVLAEIYLGFRAFLWGWK